MGRRLGQHFLNDPAILDRVVGALDAGPADVVIEIGAGRGSLTRRLARAVGAVVAIERDPVLARALTPESPGESGLANVRVEIGDALEADWHALAASTGRVVPPFKIVGNIPYAITTLLIEKALLPPFPERIVFLVQLEVAERVTAQPRSKQYGALSVGVQVESVVERLFTVRAGSFQPPPRVDSAVIRLTPRDPPLVHETERAGFRRFVVSLFSQRRKQMQRILRSVLGWEREEVLTRLSELGLDPSLRPEMLDPPMLLRLYRGLTPLMRRA